MNETSLSVSKASSITVCQFSFPHISSFIACGPSLKSEPFFPTVFQLSIMAVLTFRDRVMILELIFYTPALGLSIWLTARHGLWRRSGFIFLVLLALVRINGACMLLATLLHPDSIVLYTGAGILNSIALSPLLLATAGLLGRV
jgi:hypothetical protein